MTVQTADLTEQEYLDTKLERAVANDDVATVRALIDQGADPSVNDDGLFLKCARENLLDTMKALVDAGGVSVEIKDNYAVKEAAKNGYTDMVAFLIESGADMSAQGHYALKWAGMNGHMGVVHLMVRHGAPVDELPPAPREAYDEYLETSEEVKQEKAREAAEKAFARETVRHDRVLEKIRKHAPRAKLGASGKGTP